MSLFNMMLSGGGEGFKVATPSTYSSSQLTFAVDSEPQEYMLMLISSTSVWSTSGEYTFAFVINTLDYDIKVCYGMANGKARNYVLSSSASQPRVSYSNGAFRMSISSSTYVFSSFAENYVLYYK